MIMIDSRQVYNVGRGGRKTLSANTFYCQIAEELDDKDFNDRGTYMHHMQYYENAEVVCNPQLKGPNLRPTEERAHIQMKGANLEGSNR